MKKKEKISVNSSVSYCKQNKIFTPEIISNIKYKEIHEKFEKLFKTHGYFLSDSFDKRVWFLKDDMFFQKIINKTDTTTTSTPMEGDRKNKIHEILSELNENSDYSHLLVSVEKFIYRIIETLLISNSTIERSSRTIKSFNAVERKQNIEECIRLLEEKVEKSSLLNKQNKIPKKEEKNENKDISSNFKIKILKVIDFNPGIYHFGLKYYEIKPEKDTLIMNQINYQLNKKIGIRVNSHTQNIEEFNEFEEIIFYALQNFYSNTVKVKNNINSGTSFSNFFLVCSDNPNENKSNIKYESKKVYCLEIILNTLDNILDISKSSFKENIEIKMYSNPHSTGSPNPVLLDNKFNEIDKNTMTVILEITFEFDELTRAAILKRISSVFKEVLDTKQYNEDLINLILDGYFDIINDGVRNILNKSMEQQREACCDCAIF